VKFCCYPRRQQREGMVGLLGSNAKVERLLR
jgi:hypothetical protein